MSRKVEGTIACLIGNEAFEFGDFQGESEQEFKDNLAAALRAAADHVEKEWDTWPTV